MQRAAIATPCTLLAAVLAAGTASSVVHAQPWAHPVNGNWFDASMRSPMSAPTEALATGTLGLAGPYSVFTTSNTLLGVNIPNSQATLSINGGNGLTPVGSSLDTINTLNGQSVVILAPSGGTRVDIATACSVDRVVSIVTTAIDGTLRVTTAMDFRSATTFDIVTGCTVTGAFDTVLSTGLSAPKRFGAAVSPGRVRATVLCGLADVGGADSNGDGLLDNNDLIAFIDPSSPGASERRQVWVY